MKTTMAISITLLLMITFSAACGNNALNTNSSPDRTSLSTPNPAGSNTNMNVAANNSNSNMSATPGNFWTSAATGGMAEVELGRLATTKAQNADVKNYAQMMITDHSKANDELKALAAKKNVVLPTSLDAKHQAAMQKLQGLSAADFDRAYVEEMVKDHEETVQLFEKQSGDDSDPDAKAFASKTLPTLRKHLDAIKNIQAKMK